jgi:Ca-activated chloride channel homolog
MGHLASSNSRPATRTTGSCLRRNLLGALLAASLIALALLTGGFPVTAQSGRQKVPKSSKSKPVPGPIADPSRTPVFTSSPPPPNSVPRNPTDEIEESDVIRVASNLIPIPATVVDPKGSAITALKLEDFELRVDGQLKPISELTRAETSVRLVMLFDNSGSLDYAREFEKRAAMHFFRRVMRPIDEAAIYSVETESYLAQPLTYDVSRLEQTIANFGKPEGATSLFDALIDAAHYLRPVAGRKVMVIVSDGIETMREGDFEPTLQEVLKYDCQIFVVQTGLYDGANLRALAAERRMEQLTLQTGGAVYIPKTTDELESAFEQIAADLAQQYVLSYYSADERRDGRFHSIELRIKSRKDLRVRARKGYYSVTRNVAVN